MQRDFIVEMINFAVIKFKNSLKKILKVNTHDNQYAKKKSNIPIDIDKHIKPKLKLEFILSDLVLPPRGIKISRVMKKRQSFGFSQRFMLLGHS